MGESGEQALQRAIAAISQSDPIIKLLQEIQLGRMKPTDAGLRAITESWLGTYEKALSTEGLTLSGLRRIDPAPRVRVLIDAGVLPHDHPAMVSLRAAFDRAVNQAAAE